MTDAPLPSTATVLLRGLRQRCPRCGEGPVFVATRGVTGHRACTTCAWRLVRSEGHWIGGAEINLCSTFVVGVVVVGLALLAFGNVWWVHAGGALYVTVFCVTSQRRSRSLFFAFDYLIDPHDDDEDTPRSPPGGPRDLLEPGDDAPRPAGGGGRGARRHAARPRPSVTTPSPLVVKAGPPANR